MLRLKTNNIAGIRIINSLQNKNKQIKGQTKKMRGTGYINLFPKREKEKMKTIGRKVGR